MCLLQIASAYDLLCDHCSIDLLQAWLASTELKSGLTPPAVAIVISLGLTWPPNYGFASCCDMYIFLSYVVGRDIQLKSFFHEHGTLHLVRKAQSIAGLHAHSINSGIQCTSPQHESTVAALCLKLLRLV
jgi:hypothetical protein